MKWNDVVQNGTILRHMPLVKNILKLIRHMMGYHFYCKKIPSKEGGINFDRPEINDKSILRMANSLLHNLIFCLGRITSSLAWTHSSMVLVPLNHHNFIRVHGYMALVPLNHFQFGGYTLTLFPNCEVFIWDVLLLHLVAFILEVLFLYLLS